MSKPSVLVIGSGVVGLSSAYYLQQRGYQVTVLEARTKDYQGCSFGNGGMIVPSHFTPLAAPGMVGMGLRMALNRKSPFGMRMHLDSEFIDWAWKFIKSSKQSHVERSSPLLKDLNLLGRATYEDLALATGNSFGLTQKGLIMLCKEQHTLDEESSLAERASELGLQVEVLDAHALKAKEPHVTFDVAGGVHFLDDCHLDPELFMATLRELFADEGGEIQYGSKVESIKMQGAQVCSVRTTSGEIAADEFVLAAGSWSPALANQIGLQIPIMAGKGYSFSIENPVEHPTICSILTEARVAVTPMGRSLRFAGTMEIGGLNERVNWPRVEGILESIPKYFPAFKGLSVNPEDVWVGLRPVSPDGLPYIGRPAAFSNLTVATGHAMMGMSLGPATGKLVAQIVADERPEVDLGLVSPDRFSPGTQKSFSQTKGQHQ